MSNNSRISDQIKYIVVRLQTSSDERQNWTGFGTGFFYAFEIEDNSTDPPKSSYVHAIITNRHVIEGAKMIGFTLHESSDTGASPKPGRGRMIADTTDRFTILSHPRLGLDLVAILFWNQQAQSENLNNCKYFVKTITKRDLPTQDLLNEICSIEDVVMAGYPRGLVDEANNFPIVRKGITATPYGSDYQGLPEFLIDMPIFQGSSGSPVFLLNEGSYAIKDDLALGQRFKLLGIQRAAYFYDEFGEIKELQMPTQLKQGVDLRTMINLGVCLKSALIEEFVPQVRSLAIPLKAVAPYKSG